MMSKSADPKKAVCLTLRRVSSKNAVLSLRTPGFSVLVSGTVPTSDMQPVLPLPGVPGTAFDVQFGMVLYNQSVWSKSLFVSKNAPTMPRMRQSSGVLTRNSLLRCSLRSVSRHVELGEKHFDVRLGVGVAR